MQTLRINLKNNAPTQYTNFDFTSMCVFNGAIIGAGPGGLFKACCGSDDNGDDIDAYFIPYTVDFGDTHNKRLRRVYICGKLGGDMNLTVTGNGDSVNGPYAVSPDVDETTQERLFSINRGQGYKWTYAEFKFENVDGASFSIDSALALYTVHHRRRR